MSKPKRRKRQNTSVRQRIECFMKALPDLNPNWKTSSDKDFKKHDTWAK